jgi:hypothetical protein
LILSMSTVFVTTMSFTEDGARPALAAAAAILFLTILRLSAIDIRIPYRAEFQGRGACHATERKSTFPLTSVLSLAGERMKYTPSPLAGEGRGEGWDGSVRSRAVTLVSARKRLYAFIITADSILPVLPSARKE